MTLSSGRILYCDNWYTSLSLAEKLFLKFHWLLVGTVTEKKTREDYDIPFHKLSSKGLDTVVRGWSRSATRNIKNDNGKKRVLSK